MFFVVPVPKLSQLTGKWARTWVFAKFLVILENILSVSAVGILGELISSKIHNYFVIRPFLVLFISPER